MSTIFYLVRSLWLTLHLMCVITRIIKFNALNPSNTSLVFMIHFLKYTILRISIFNLSEPALGIWWAVICGESDSALICKSKLWPWFSSWWLHTCLYLYGCTLFALVVQVRTRVLTCLQVRVHVLACTCVYCMLVQLWCKWGKGMDFLLLQELFELLVQVS